MTRGFDLSGYGITAPVALRNPSLGLLYEDGLVCDGDLITAGGALATNSGDRTTRSLRDRRIVESETSASEAKAAGHSLLTEKSFAALRKQAVDYFNTCGRVYVVEGFAGADPTHRLKVRAVCARPYHALVMRNLLTPPGPADLGKFAKPDVTILNAGQAPADPKTQGVSSATSVSISLDQGEIVLLGSEYAGEMREALATVLHNRLAQSGILSLPCAASASAEGEVSLFFGDVSTTKTELALDARRQLIGEFAHAWTSEGVFSFESGCYVRCRDWSAASPLHGTLGFGAVLENVAVPTVAREVDFQDTTLSENARACLPLAQIPHALPSGRGGKPAHLFFLTSDALGVLPAISRLNAEQALQFFLCGYSSKPAAPGVPGGQPQVKFSPCFGEGNLTHAPSTYAELFLGCLARHQPRVWLLNTGWVGNPETGRKVELAETQAIVDAIHADQLKDATLSADTQFGLLVPDKLAGISPKLLHPITAWSSLTAYKQAADQLTEQMVKHLAQFAPGGGGVRGGRKPAPAGV